MHRRGLEAFAIYWLQFLFHFDRKAFPRELQFISKWTKKKIIFFLLLCWCKDVELLKWEQVEKSIFKFHALGYGKHITSMPAKGPRQGINTPQHDKCATSCNSEQ